MSQNIGRLPYNWTAMELTIVSMLSLGVLLRSELRLRKQRSVTAAAANFQKNLTTTSFKIVNYMVNRETATRYNIIFGCR